MTTTLILSDLHLGMRSGQDLMRRPEIRARLLERLDGIDRVVLLGDAVELRHGPIAGQLAAAEPFFRELGEAMADGEVVLVPGNHDHRLLAAWHERRRVEGAALGLEQRIAPRAGEPGATLAGWLWPARFTFAYPGLWLRDGVYAIHGHYLDRHVTIPTIERLAIGGIGWFSGPFPDAPGPDDYEAALAPLYALAHELAQGIGAGAAQRRSIVRMLKGGRGDRPPRLGALGPALGPVLAVLNRAGLGPLRRDVGIRDLEAAGLAAMREVADRLVPEASHVVFGHLHRAGPRAGDDPAAWRASSGTQLVNTGTWVRERRLLADPAGERGYWPGTAVLVEPTGPPRVLHVLDDLRQDGLPDSSEGALDFGGDEARAPAPSVRDAVEDDRHRADQASLRGAGGRRSRGPARRGDGAGAAPGSGAPSRAA